jgi:hypothetical protein
MNTYKSIKRNPSLIKDYKSRENVLLTCNQCGNEYSKPKNQIQVSISAGKKTNFCSKLCNDLYFNKKKEVSCKNCQTPFYKSLAQIRKSKNNFCSKSCSASHNSKNRKCGTTRSKLEAWLEDKLIDLYSDLDIQFNKKDVIGSELDIYIPSLKLAFEINGIFHYKPIYGEEKLEQIQQNDKTKNAECDKNDIKLYSIDTSEQDHFTEKSSIKYFKTISSIINECLNE